MAQRPDSPLPPAGRLTTGLFRMRKNYARWREHGAPGWLLIYTLGGRGRFGHEKGETILEKGDLVLLMPRTRNDYGLVESDPRWDLLWAYFFPRAEWHPFLKWPEIAPGHLGLHLSHSTERTRLVRSFQKVHQVATGPLRHREMRAMNQLEKTLLLCDELNPRSAQPRVDTRIYRVMDFICQNFSRPLTLDALARPSGLSVSRMSHLFREQTGQTPHQFLESQRMARAKQLLALTHDPVKLIAAEVGFPDLFHFSKRFKKQHGISPRGYRQKL